MLAYVHAVHYCFSVWQETMADIQKQREIDAQRERMAHMQNAQYERALKAWVQSVLASLKHYCFSVWQETMADTRKNLEIEAQMARDST